MSSRDPEDSERRSNTCVHCLNDTDCDDGIYCNRICWECSTYVTRGVWRNLYRIGGLIICMSSLFGVCFFAFKIPVPDEAVKWIIYAMLTMLFLAGVCLILTNKKKSCLNVCAFLKRKKKKNKDMEIQLREIEPRPGSYAESYNIPSMLPETVVD
jgi:hypothetical protein